MLQELADKLIENREYVQTVWADCSVKYEGRAEGSTDKNHRLLLFKPDGNIQVIGAEKHKPVNWQPTGASLSTEHSDEHVFIHSEHPRTGDLLEIRVYSAHSYNAVDVESGSRCELEDTESDYHEYLINNPQVIGLSQDANLKHEVQTDVGRVDLYDDKNNVIIEVKRKKATLDSVSQLTRYKNNLEPSEAVLACPSITDTGEKLAARNGLRVELFEL